MQEQPTCCAVCGAILTEADVVFAWTDEPSPAYPDGRVWAAHADLLACVRVTLRAHGHEAEIVAESAP